ncbi:hypothetical protein KF913_07775 [Candidatus Obscuribacterales bacterium]|nr:hypothetical protein [Candidatus Obscuribacterales bacterium]
MVIQPHLVLSAILFSVLLFGTPVFAQSNNRPVRFPLKGDFGTEKPHEYFETKYLPSVVSRAADWNDWQSQLLDELVLKVRKATPKSYDNKRFCSTTRFVLSSNQTMSDIQHVSGDMKYSDEVAICDAIKRISLPAFPENSGTESVLVTLRYSDSKPRKVITPDGVRTVKRRPDQPPFRLALEVSTNSVVKQLKRNPIEFGALQDAK